MDYQDALTILARDPDDTCNRGGCDADAQYHCFTSAGARTGLDPHGLDDGYEGGYCDDHANTHYYSHPAGDIVITRAEFGRYLARGYDDGYAAWSAASKATGATPADSRDNTPTAADSGPPPPAHSPVRSRRTPSRIDLVMGILMLAAAAILGTAAGLVIYARV
jgi:hypothetical protein